jgi:hypothetical protein
MDRRIIEFLIIFTLGVFFISTVTSVSAQTENKIFGKRPFSVLKSLQPEADGNLDQCANGPVGGAAVPCTGGAWQNGNLNHNQAHYNEGESIPYRIVFSDMVVGSTNTVRIEWDTTENSGGNHALDYLTTFNRTETTANPCSGVPGCNLLVNDTISIPLDPRVAAGRDGIPGNGDDVVQEPGVFTFYDAQILGVSNYTFTGNFETGSQTSITITFRALSATPVLAWSGHIATRLNWGTDHSAIAIPGSPYHMRILDINGSGGNQDRSLSASAVIFPGVITIIKDARPNTDQIFTFTAAGPGVSNFSLVDDGINPNNSQVFSNLTFFGTANAVTVTEGLPVNNYHLMQINCVEDPSGGSGQQNSTVNVSLRTANIILEEGESVVCTFVNAVPTAATAVISGRVFDIYGGAVKDVVVSVTDLATGEVRSTRTNNFGAYRFAELAVGDNYFIAVRSRRYTFAADSITVTLMDDLSGQDFTAIPIN